MALQGIVWVRAILPKPHRLASIAPLCAIPNFIKCFWASPHPALWVPSLRSARLNSIVKFQNMQTQWCPYTDQHLDLSEMNDEHVIPLSLGGHSQFTIPVERVINSELGNKLDAAISSNPLVASARRHYGLLGHTKSDPIVRWPTHHKGMKGTLDRVIVKCCVRQHDQAAIS